MEPDRATARPGGGPRLEAARHPSALVRRAEEFVREQPGRGVYADTPVTNETARSLYRALRYEPAYTMPGYYDNGLDGVTYLKMFPT